MNEPIYQPIKFPGIDGVMFRNVGRRELPMRRDVQENISYETVRGDDFGKWETIDLEDNPYLPPPMKAVKAKKEEKSPYRRKLRI